jgi:PAS domain S-box-containing protein
MNRTAQSLNRLCAALVTIGAALALAGWVFHISVLTRLSPSFIPTQFNSALCFLFYGLGLWGLNGGRLRLARGLGGAMLAIGLLSLFEHATGISLGIDTLAGFYITGPGITHPGRMATSTTIALACLGAALILFARGELTERRSAVLAALGSVVAAVGLSGFLAFAARLQSASGWVGFTQIGFPSAALCLLAGTNVLLNLRSRFKASATWLPIPLGAGLVALLVTLTAALSADQDAAFSNRIEITAQTFAQESQLEMSEMFAALDRMAHRWNVAGGTPQAVWDADTTAYLAGYPGLGSIIWAEPDGHIGRIARARRPGASSRNIGDQALADVRRLEAAHSAARSRQPQVTGALTLRNGGEGFAYISPLASKGVDDGFQVATIGVKGFFGNVLKRTDTAQFDITVLEDGKPIYASTPAAAARSRWTRDAALTMQNNRWRVAVTPTEAFLVTGRSNLPGIFFAAGCVFILLTTASFFFALRSRHNATVLQLREQDLERSEERYELAVRGSGVGLWDRNVVTGELYLSPRVLQIMGFPPDFVADRNELLGRVHPHDIGIVGPELFRAVMEKRPYDIEGRVRRKDDTYIWVRLRGVPVFDDGGTLVRVAGSLDDITALKQAEAEVKASEESFRATMESAPVGMALISPDAKLIKANKALSALTGYSEAELLATDPRELFPEAFDEDRRQIARLLSGQVQHYVMEQKFRTKTGKEVWALTNASLARNADGRPRHVVKQLLDISERKEMDRMKSEFISVVSHELRTPLTAIRGSLGLMASAMRDSLPPKALHLVEIGHRNAERLITLVNDILDMEKLAANRMPFELKLEDLAVLAAQAVESTAAYAEKYKVTYLLENRGADLPVQVDKDRLAQVFANLLSNAAKFSPEGGRVRMVIRSRAGRARFEVIDRGPGIAEEFRPRIFGRFAQADSSITRAKGGTGLGLHITRELVEKMGGTIGFESATGQGTTFWVEFPIVEALRDIAPSVAAPHIPRVLHVEDDVDLTSILAAGLKGRVELIAARTVKEADMLLRSREFAAVILDVGMPDGSGLSLIEGLGHAINPPPVIILSAREVDPALTKGAVAVLVKSKIAESEIAQTVLDVLAGAPPAANRAAS